MQGDEAEKIAKRLDVIINLLIRQEQPEGAPLEARDKIRLLDEIGVDASTIAQIVNMRGQDVGRILGGIRKARR